MEEIPRKYRDIFKRAKSGRNRKDSIHAMCLTCMSMKKEGIRTCTDFDCPLFSVRPYGVAPRRDNRYVTKCQGKKFPRRVSQTIEVPKGHSGRVRVKIEIEPEKEK